MFCEKCGKQLTDGATFCAFCGHRVGEPPETADTSAQVSEMPAAQQAPVMSAAQGIATATPVASAVSTVASVASGTAAVAGKAVVGGVKTAHRAAKRVAICAVVVVFLIGAATACLNFFVSGPEKTVETFFEAIENLDADEMMGCLDPKLEKQMRAALGLGGDLFGAITGFGLDFENLLTLAPLFGSGLDMPELTITSVEVVLYADYSVAKITKLCEEAEAGRDIGEGYQADNDIIQFLHQYHLTIPGLEKLIAKTAIVRVTVAGESEAAYIPMQNVGMGDWRLALDFSSLDT